MIRLIPNGCLDQLQRNRHGRQVIEITLTFIKLSSACYYLSTATMQIGCQSADGKFIELDRRRVVMEPRR